VRTVRFPSRLRRLHPAGCGSTGEGIPAESPLGMKGRSNENTRNGVEAEKGTGAVERRGVGLWLRGWPFRSSPCLLAIFEKFRQVLTRSQIQ
jgi:hypothetical protein